MWDLAPLLIKYGMILGYTTYTEQWKLDVSKVEILQQGGNGSMNVSSSNTRRHLNMEKHYGGLGWVL